MRCPGITRRRSASPATADIWFLPWDGVSVLDPRRLPFNTLPPPVHIEQVTADRQVYAPAPELRLPPHVRDLSIDFTALSLVAPEKVHFRYILEGQDPEWKEVVNDRRAHYSNLPHGQYRFRVQASNNSGVWNEEGAGLQFAIAPAYYETRWFQAVCAAAIVGLFWTAHRLHVRHVVRQLNLTVEARVDERTRIARELHDTLLQGFQGLLLMFQSALQPVAGPAGGSEATARARARAGQCGDDRGPACRARVASLEHRDDRSCRVPPEHRRGTDEGTGRLRTCDSRRGTGYASTIEAGGGRRGLSHHGGGAAQCPATRGCATHHRRDPLRRAAVPGPRAR